MYHIKSTEDTFENTKSRRTKTEMGLFSIMCIWKNLKDFAKRMSPSQGAVYNGVLRVYSRSQAG